jgi:hypothetical protein
MAAAAMDPAGAGVAEIAAACRALLDWRSSPPQRDAAAAFVGALRKAPSWRPVSEAVGCEPALESGVRVLAAQTLRAQAQRQRQPPAPEMVATVMQLLAVEAARADGRPVVTQLCLAAAAAGARAQEWPVTEVLARLTAAEALPQGVRLELVALLPEELDEKRLSMNPARRQALREALRGSSAEVEGWVRAACGGLEAGDGALHQQPHVGAAFRWVKSWIAFDLLAPSTIAASPLLPAAVAAVLDASLPESTREEAADVICAACTMAERGPLYQVLPQLDALAAGVQAHSSPLLSVRRCACRSVVAIGVAMAPDLLAWAPSAGSAEGATLSQLTATLGATSLDQDQELAGLTQEFWIALADALSSTAGAEANLPLLQWMVGVCAARCVLPVSFLLAPAEEDGEEEAEEARVAAADVLKAVAEGPALQVYHAALQVHHASALMSQLEGDLVVLVEQARTSSDHSDGGIAARLEAMVYIISMVAKSALSNAAGQTAQMPAGDDAARAAGEALEALGQCTVRLLETISALVPLFVSVPLLHRTCLVAIGTLSPVATRSSSALNAAVEAVGGSLSLPAARLRAWGRGEDHVGSVAFWRLATNCATQLRPTLPQLAAGTMTAEVRAAMEARGWGGRRTDGRKLLVRGLCAVLTESARCLENDEELVSSARAVVGPLLAEIQAGTKLTPEMACADEVVWSDWCEAYCDSVGLLGAAISAAPSRAVCLLWPQIWDDTVSGAVELAFTLGSASPVFQVLVDAVVDVLVEIPRCFAAPVSVSPSQGGIEAAALGTICSVAATGFSTPTLLHRTSWLRPLSATIRCSKDGGSSAAQQALASAFPRAAMAFFAGLELGGRSSDENATAWASMYSLTLDLAVSCPTILNGDSSLLPSLLDTLASDLLRSDGCAASDRVAGIAGLRLLAKLPEWATAEPGAVACETRTQLAALVHQWLAARGALASIVGILVAASGTLAPWMIDNLADALWGLGEVLGGDRLSAVLHEALCSELLPNPVRRLKPEARTTALGPLLGAKDRRVFKRCLKAICGGKKKGVSGAPPAAASSG